jgi:adenosylcobinamide-phosphate synthase
VFAGAVLVVRLAAQVSFFLEWCVEVWLLFTSLAMRSLWVDSMRVAHALRADDLEAARFALGQIVGRDTANLPEPEIIRGAVESVAENSVDGVLAPLLFAFIGGAPLALAYKAVNTLDSMVGYRSPRYARFGWAAARLDDLVNYLPARLAAGFLVLSAFLFRRRGSAAWRVVRRDHGRHPSPNAGYPEAAVAGALGIQLGGPSTYHGVSSQKPRIGDAQRQLVREDIRTANILVASMAALAVVLGILIRVAYYGVG